MKKKTWILLIIMFAIIAFIGVNQNEVFANQNVEMEEQKNYCIATLEKNFEEDKIIVILTKKATYEFRDYEPRDFAEIDCVEVKELTKFTAERIKKELEIQHSMIKMKEIIEKETLIDIDNYHRILVITLKEKNKVKVLEAIRLLENRSDILIAEPNYIYESNSVTTEQNSSSYDYEDFINGWGVDNIQAEKVWDFTTGDSSVLVGVIDSGIDINHDFLRDKVDENIHKDYISPSIFNSNTALIDNNGHGTQVAGVIASVAKDVTLVSIKAMQGGTLEGIGSVVDLAQNYNISILMSCTIMLGIGHIAPY